MRKNSATPSLPVRSEHRDETGTMIDINSPCTSTVTAVTTATLPACPQRSTPSYSQLVKDIKLNPAGIRTDDFVDFHPARNRRPKAKVVPGKSISGNTFNGGHTTRNVFLFRVNCNVSEDIEPHNGKDLQYVSIKTMSNAESVFKSCLITAEARDYGTIMHPDVWTSETLTQGLYVYLIMAG